MEDVKLCSDCKFRHVYIGDLKYNPCGAHPEAKRLKDAREQCGGKEWIARYPRLQPGTRSTFDRW